MAISPVAQQAAQALQQLTNAPLLRTPPTIVIENQEVLTKLGEKLQELARKDPKTAVGLVDLIQNLSNQGRFKADFGFMPGNNVKNLLNDVKEILNANGSAGDDRPLQSLRR